MTFQFSQIIVSIFFSSVVIDFNFVFYHGQANAKKDLKQLRDEEETHLDSMWNLENFALAERLATIHAKVMVVHPLYVKLKMVAGMLLVLVNVCYSFHQISYIFTHTKYFVVNQGIIGECGTETPGIYTDIYHYKDFIESVDTSTYSDDYEYIDIEFGIKSGGSPS